MSALTLDSLRCWYFPEDMAQIVYKFSFCPDYPDAAFVTIWENFNDFKAFYREVALLGEAVLTVMD